MSLEAEGEEDSSDVWNTRVCPVFSELINCLRPVCILDSLVTRGLLSRDDLVRLRLSSQSEEEQARILFNKYLLKRPERDFYTFMEVLRSSEGCAKAFEILNRLSSTASPATPSRVLPAVSSIEMPSAGNLERSSTDDPFKSHYRISLHFGSEFSPLVDRYKTNLLATAKDDLEAELRICCTDEGSHTIADSASSNHVLVLQQRNSVLLILNGISVSEFTERRSALLDVLSTCFSVSQHELNVRETGSDVSVHVVIEISAEAVLSLITLRRDRNRLSVLKADFHRLLPEVSAVVFQIDGWPSLKIVIEVSALNKFFT